MSEIIRGGRGVSSVSFLEALERQDVWGIRPSLDKMIDGQYEHNGVSAMLFEASVGAGKGASKLEVEGGEFSDVVDFLSSFDPDAESPAEELTTLEIVKRTLKADEETVTFKVSLEKHSRSISVPRDLWPDFVQQLTKWADELSDGTAVERCRNMVRRVIEQQDAARRKVNKT